MSKHREEPRYIKIQDEDLARLARLQAKLISILKIQRISKIKKGIDGDYHVYISYYDIKEEGF